MRAKILLAALIALALSASPAAADTFTVDGMQADTYGQPTQGRVFMFHAMNGTRAHDGNQAQVIDGLVSSGYQVIAPDEPYDDHAQAAVLHNVFLADSTEGQSYRDQWATYTHDLIAAADARYGAAPRLLMSGQSWGGFSAMLAACQNPEVDGYVVTIPLTDPNTYGPFQDVPLSNLKLDSCTGRLRSIPGFIAWGDSDLIVGSTATRNLVDRLDPYAVVSCEYAKLGHEDSPTAYAGMVRWATTGTRDCLAWPEEPTAVSVPVAAATPPATGVAAPVPVKSAARHCNHANRCESVVRRHKLFHVYGRRSKHPRWVYVRKAR